MMHVVEMVGIFADCSHHHQQAKNKFSLAINAVGRTSSRTCMLRLPALLKNIFNTTRLAASDS
jgi:hypothetical protein